MYKNKAITVLAVVLILFIAIYMFTFTGTKLDYVLPRRGYKVAAMILISFAIGYSSIIFQTISANRILTPSIMGFDSFYLLLQSLLVFAYGDKTFQILTSEKNFAISVVLMLGFSLVMYYAVFKRESKSMYLLLLVGLLMGTLFRSFSSFISMLIDPNEFLMIQSAMFASFDKINLNLLGISAVLLIVSMIAGSRYFRQLDVLSLGRENAISLGVDYHKVIKANLLIISVMVAISTALVGPITFLGILVANLTYELVKSSKHSQMVLACCLLTSVTVIGGQYLVEHLFNMSTTISIIINFVGGVYFIYLLLKSNKG
ncbi:iron chelate uptake ABC transporter family permease subunit [Myroides marinus]|uniref:Iron complex transport system permease protein n=1 Tax=Myroides marinus TaxID=703342 RepID=A0A1H6U4N3_9FLAO|nr:iron chelate uptake ABC transporter family permease subunit [Myroides marinus]KUF38250.1 iron ABC transporter permease [Myroides marinus]MDM1347778.1 iron chelate uptake ABC transporter family permease subunit [Myroides marinus]MDM1351412.1 iron chelate uptake ABC transporter family permease subunit [Myroides marinus]MDM1355052.1 iron chelate uptake ABC transporter family permease subunit [Myroides marinus]MDM1358619.1 iron chelate uptake ABC transporter family permease subunit [Myroides ma